MDGWMVEDAPNLGCVCQRASFHFIAPMNLQMLLHTTEGLQHRTHKRTHSGYVKDTHCQDILGSCQLVFVWAASLLVPHLGNNIACMAHVCWSSHP